MSTEDTNKAVVTLNLGVDVDAFIEDMISGTNHNEFMPNRRVELYNEKPDSLRNVDFVLTRAEAELLKGDDRVIDVRYGTKEENGIFFKANSTSGSQLYSKTNTLDNTHYNWGIPASINATNPFITTDLTYTHNYPVAGRSVDVVIQDSGILPAHPEWLDATGTTSRLQQIDWPVVTNTTAQYTQGPLHYTDQNGHGTHVAGTVAGRLYGWAKDSNIYAIKIFDTDSYGVSASINMIRIFHSLKSVTSTGYKRPTIVNMSWEYYKIYENITGGVYRGTPWTATTLQSLYGMVSTIYNKVSGQTRYYHPLRVASVDADLQDCINAGVIMVAAAGNDAHKIDVSTGPDYDNSYTNSVDGIQYYHRGGTPNNTAGVITVGSVKIAQPEGKNFFSNSGPGITVWAAGEQIMSAIPEGSVDELSAGSVAYPLNNSFKSTKLSGTSMAAPQVTGVLSTLLDARPEYTQTSVRIWISETSSINRLSDTAGGTLNFTVTNNGSFSYSINSATNPTLNLVRGFTYYFNVSATGHPFWIKSSQVTGTAGAYSSGVVNNGTANGQVAFTVPSNAPSTLYYICQLHSAMTGVLSISDGGTSFTDLQSLQGAPNKFLKQPFNGANAWKFTGN